MDPLASLALSRLPHSPHLGTSALPHAPVVPASATSSARRRIAVVLHGVAGHLDPGLVSASAGTSRPAMAGG